MVTFYDSLSTAIALGLSGTSSRIVCWFSQFEARYEQFIVVAVGGGNIPAELIALSR